MKNLLQFIDIHVNFLFYYNRIIINKWPEFYQYRLSDNSQLRSQFEQIYIKKSFLYIQMPALIILLATINNVSYLLHPELSDRPFWALIRLYPDNIHSYTASMMSFWSLIVIGHAYFSLSTRLSDFHFLWVLQLNQTNYQTHSILSEDWERLKKFQKNVINTVRTLITWINILVVFVFLIKIFNDSLLEFSFGWTIFWYLGLVSMGWSTCSSNDTFSK